jgi:beta-lactamase class A
MPYVSNPGAGRRRSVALGLVVAAATMLCAGCGSSKPAAASTSRTTSSAPTAAFPNTPAGAQIRWLIGAAEHLPIPSGSVRVHFDAAVLARIDPSQLNQALASVGTMLGGSGAVRLATIEVGKPRQLVATVARVGGPPRLTASLTVDGNGLISGLVFRPVQSATPTSWQAIHRAVRSVAPDVRVLVASVAGGSCQALHGIDASTPAPLGSMFKLYVLDALGRAVAARKLSWSERLTITAALKALPSGQLQNEPNGTKVSVTEVVDKLISISDNTAADMLISRLGQRAIDSALTTSGMGEPARDEPFLSPRELFILKLDQWPALAWRYLAADQAGRQALLASIDSRPLPALASVASLIKPRDIDGIEWFASADDICRVYASLSALARRPGLSPVAGALEINDGGLGLAPAQWKTTWFKGGSEPGVLTLAYLATTRTGRTYVVTVLAENPSAPINETTAAPVLLAAIKGAFALAARG